MKKKVVKNNENKDLEIAGRLERGEHLKPHAIHLYKLIDELLEKKVKCKSKSALMNFLALHYLGLIDLHAETKLNVYDIERILEKVKSD